MSNQLIPARMFDGQLWVQAGEVERLREQLKHQCELNDAAAEDADALRRELAEARGLLREARDAMGGKRELDGMREQIDAFLAADQPTEVICGCIHCGRERPLSYDCRPELKSDKSSPR